ncbi:MAG: thiol reductant ABC exporter subunit CydC [Alphaproteobacteria bacterium]
MYFDARLWAFTEGLRARMAGTVAIGVAAAATGIARLALLGWLIGRIYMGASAGEILAIAAAIVGVIGLRAVLMYLKETTAHRTAALVQRSLRRRLHDHLVVLGPGYVGQERSGDVALNLVEGVDQLEVYFGGYLPQLAIAALTPLLLFSFLAFLDLPVATVILAAALVTLIAPTVFHRWNRRFALRRRTAYGAFAADFLDAIQGLGTLKAFGQSAPRAAALADRARDVFRTTMWVLASNAATHGITVAGIALGTATALALGAHRVVTGEMDLAVLIVIVILGTEAFRPLRELSSLLHYGMVGLSATEGIARLLDARPTVTDPPAPARLSEPFQPTIDFDDVSFAYPGGRRAAHTGLSFRVAAGESVAIVGASGAGKSSILRLLLRLYDPQGGAVRLGGIDLRALALSDIRQRIAVVSQDTVLFHGTVEDNIRLGRPGATQAEVESAARAANVHTFVESLPQGYATLVGERGVRLSGGQRQRIAIARALLRDAPVLVLDEALSAVDAENEWVIQEALDRLMRGRTTLIFAHRLSSVIGADRILVLDQGRIVESGSHAELIRAGGVYAALMAEQAAEARGTQRMRARAVMEPSEPDDGVQAPEEIEPPDEILGAHRMGTLAVFRELLRLVSPWRWKLTAALVLGILRVVTLIGVGVAGGLVVLALKQGEPHGLWLVLLFVLAPTTALLHWLESWVSHDVAFRLLSEMRIALFEKIDRLAPAWLVRRRTGDLVGMATHDVELIEYFFAHTIAPAFVAVLVPGAVLATLLLSGWPLALVLLPFLGLVAASPFLARHRLDRAGASSRAALGSLNAHAVDGIQGMAEVVAYGRQQARGEALDDLGDAYYRARLPYFRDLAVQKAVLDAATGLGGLAVVSVGAALVAAGQLDAAMLPLLAILAMAAFLPVSEIAEIGRRLADTIAATRRVHTIHAEPVPVRDGPGVPEASIDPEAPAVAMESVTFAYPGRARPALRQVSFAAPAGATVAIVGPSGAGKSTVAQLLLRFWDPQSGIVRVQGYDARDWTLEALRRRIALVAQDTYLFNDTLRANILIARPGASDAELERAIGHAALSEFVAALPRGLDTMVGERGTQLSGGQRQRVAIARAFLKDAPILVLDEATSHLDALSEIQVRKALDRLMSDRTTIVIAHRLSTVRQADLILVMDEGRLAEQGTHAALLARGGLYAHLVSRQLAGAAA